MNQQIFHRVKSWIGIIAILLFTTNPSIGFAARPDSLKDVISDSRPSVAANHTVTLNQAAGGQVSAGDTLTVDLPAGFDTSGFASTEPEDFDITVNATEETIVSSADTCGDDEIEVTTVDTTNDIFTFTFCTGYTTEAAGSDIVIEIGTNATAGSSGNDQITNPTAGTYQILVDTSDEDSQDTVLVVTDGVTVSATVDEALTNTVAGLAPAACDTTGGTEITTTSTTVPFSTISTEAFYDGCQQLTVGTNAAGGYAVTVYTTTGLDSGINAFSPGSCDGGGCTLTTPNTWATASNNGYAVCMKDETGNAAATANAGWDTAGEQCGGGTQKFELVADLSNTEVPSTIMSSATSVTDVAEIGWRISADSSQAAGTYTGTADYITTGTF